MAPILKSWSLRQTRRGDVAPLSRLQADLFKMTRAPKPMNGRKAYWRG